MPDRPENIRAQLKLRLPEGLRGRLERSAERDGTSLNTVIVNCLVAWGRAQDLGEVVFGSAERFTLLAAFDRLLLSAELKIGKGVEDRDTRHLAADQISGFLKNMLEFNAAFAGRPLSAFEVQALADVTALTALSALRGRPVVFPSDPAAAEAAAAEAAVAAAAFVKRFPDHPFSRQAAEADAAEDKTEAKPSDEAA